MPALRPVAVSVFATFVWFWSTWAILTTKRFSTPKSVDGADAASLQTWSGPSTRSTVHLLFGLAGRKRGMFQEFKVALKSILLNAPLQASLQVHVMCDQDAYNAMPRIVKMTLLDTIVSAQPVHVRIYNVEAKMSAWKEMIAQTLHQWPREDLHVFRHTIGSYFRLFANDVLPSKVDHVLYLDTDVVILANLKDVWETRNSDALFTWGESMCAGFVLLKPSELPDVWKLSSAANLKAIAQEVRQLPNDQLVFRAINITHPEKVGIMPNGWDVSVADGTWEMKHSIVEERPNIGMMHFNGGAAKSNEAYYEKHAFLTQPDLVKTWGVALYYVRLPWEWTRYHIQSQIPVGQDGHLLQVEYTVVPK